MLDKIYFNFGHLTKLSYLMLESDGLNEHEKQLVLSHISSCDCCMEDYLASLTEDSLIEPSEDLVQWIVENVGVIKEEIKDKKRKTIFMQFAKMSVAVCLTMGIFFSGALGFKVGEGPPRESDDLKQSQAQASPQPQVERTKGKVRAFESFFNDLNRGFMGFADQINLGIRGDAINESK